MMKFNFISKAVVTLGLGVWCMNITTLNAQLKPPISPLPNEEQPAPTFLEAELAKHASRKKVNVTWSVTPVPETVGIYKIAILSPAKWEKAFLTRDGQSIMMITPQMINDQNLTRREGLTGVSVAESEVEEVEKLRKAVSKGEESQSFLWNFGVNGKPEGLKLLVYVSNGEIGVGN